MLSMEEKRYKLWWSGKVDGVGGIGVMVNEELCERLIGVRRVSGVSCVGNGCAEADLLVCSTK